MLLLTGNDEHKEPFRISSLIHAFTLSYFPTSSLIHSFSYVFKAHSCTWRGPIPYIITAIINTHRISDLRAQLELFKKNFE